MSPPAFSGGGTKRRVRAREFMPMIAPLNAARTAQRTVPATWGCAHTLNHILDLVRSCFITPAMPLFRRINDEV
jgi:hypothetical protein